MKTPSSADFLGSVAGYTAARAQGGRAGDGRNRLAKIDPAYTAGLPRVTFEGEDTLSVKGYPYASNYEPTAADRVLLVPVGTTYMIMCAVIA